MLSTFRIYAALLLGVCLPFAAPAQNVPQQSGIIDPEKIVKWSFSAKETAENEYDLLITATIQSGWIVYSQNIGKGGPMPTSFKFDKNGIQLVGTVNESSEHTKSGIDPTFKIPVTKYTERVLFTQHIKTLKPTKNVTGALRFLTCNDKKCLTPTDVPFSISLPSPKIAELAPTVASPNNSTISPKTPVASASKTAPAPPKTTATTATLITTTPTTTTPPTAKPTLPTVKTIFSKTKYLQPKSLAENLVPTESPVKWTFDYNAGGGEFGISAKASIKKGWYVVASLQNEGAIQPATFTLADRNNEFLNSINERGHRNFKPDLNFQHKKIAIFEDDALFSQHLRVRNANVPLQGAIVYTVCNEEGCLPVQTQKFSLDLGKQTAIIAAAQMPSSDAPQDTVAKIAPVEIPKAVPTGPVSSADFPARYKILKDLQPAVVEETSAWAIFIQGFLGGLFALFTPCVFPLIPMTVSFFLNRSKTRNEGIKNALLYGLSIILIYVGIGIVLTSIFGAALGNALATHWIPNLLFFIVFTAFAFSFFGYFELTLPSAWANKTDAQADKGGFLGIFFMAVTLVIVSFSCTGPVLGTLLVQAVTSNGSSVLGIQILPFVGMLGFSGALALPFALFALFPTWLKSLPKSGGWMNTLKVNFAFIELLLAVKFLSNIDLVYFKENASFFGGILRWEPFLILWAILFLGMALYNFGLIRFPHDDKNAPIAWGRKSFGLLSLGFVAYSVYGLVTYNPLSIFSGLVPPPYYNYFNKPKNENIADCPLGIPCHHNNLDEAIEAAAASGKPLFIDFTGDACVNCRKTENTIWPVPTIKPYIKDSMILVSLTCDNRTELAEKDIYVSRIDNREVNKIGRLFVDLQMTYFNSNSQPLYVPLYVDPKDHHTLYTLNPAPIGYPDGDPVIYEAYLKEAMINFRKIKK
ncbi:MAG: hypothetical protein RI894_1280 [Bacteroidota bacterium]|jgi:thiol:disulfide interchange protein DsbD